MDELSYYPGQAGITPGGENTSIPPPPPRSAQGEGWAPFRLSAHAIRNAQIPRLKDNAEGDARTPLSLSCALFLFFVHPLLPWAVAYMRVSAAVGIYRGGAALLEGLSWQWRIKIHAKCLGEGSSRAVVMPS